MFSTSSELHEGKCTGRTDKWRFCADSGFLAIPLRMESPPELCFLPCPVALKQLKIHLGQSDLVSVLRLSKRENALLSQFKEVLRKNRGGLFKFGFFDSPLFNTQVNSLYVTRRVATKFYDNASFPLFFQVPRMRDLEHVEFEFSSPPSRISEDAWGELRKLKKLQGLVLEYSRLDSNWIAKVLPALGRLNRLTYLSFRNSRFSFEELSTLARGFLNLRLRSLDLSNANIGFCIAHQVVVRAVGVPRPAGPFSEAVELVPPMTNNKALEVLNLAQNGLTGSITIDFLR